MPPPPASFVHLRAKGAFVVLAAYDGHSLHSLEIVSGKGNPCRIRNPWPGRRISVKAKGCKPTVSEGTDIRFDTRKGTVYHISPL